MRQNGVEPVMHVVTMGALVVAAALWWRARRRVAATSLRSAWWWGLAAVLVANAAAAVSLVDPASIGLGNHLWYAACVLWLCPAVSVLGGRRPAAQAWSLFVVFPLFLVLEWPVTGVALVAPLTGATSGTVFGPVALEWPTVIGWGLVLVMGAGNYLGTRWTLPVLLVVVGLGGLIWPMAPWVRSGLDSGTAASCRLAGGLAIVLALVRASFSRRIRGNVGQPDDDDQASSVRLDRAWVDFRDTFGLVWARRVEDRVNEDLRRLGGDVLLGVAGLEFHGEGALLPAERDAASERAEATLRRLWRRFVDDEWVDSRLGASVEAPLGATDSSRL